MRKHLGLFILLLFLLVNCKTGTEKKNKDLYKNHKGFIVEGTLAKGNAKYIYLLDGNDKKVDSTRIKKHSFLLQGTVIKPSSYFLRVQNSTKKHPIVLENNRYKMLLNGNEAMIIGGKLHTVYSNYQNDKKHYAQLKSDLLERFSKLDLSLREYLKQVDSIRKIEKKLFTKFIVDNRKNILSSTLLANVKLSSKDALKLKNKLAKNIVNQPLITQLDKIIENAIIAEEEEKIQRRKPVPLFSGVNLNGRQTHLERIIKGKKAFLIDFWASWCPPCREASPKLKELYRKYRRKGFDILTVSEDRSVDEWKSGVFIDDIESWHHIYDDFNRISSMFNVGALPHMVLIDENGKIIKNKISMESLEDELEKIFTKE